MSDVVFIGVLPPPVHGAALATKRMLGALQAVSDVTVVPFTGPQGAGVVKTSANRLSTTLRATRSAIAHRDGAIYVALPGGGAAAALLAPLATARAAGMRIYLHHHAFFYLDRRNRLFESVFRAAGPDAVHIVLCDRMAERLADRYDVGHTRMLNNLAFINPPEPATLGSDPGRGDEFVIGHMSNLSIAKGLDVMLETYEAMYADDPTLRLRLGGPADTPIEEALVRDYMARLPGIEWLGPIAQDGLGEFFGGVDVFVLPSRNEAMPLVVLEAASFGVMSVTTDVGCLSSVDSVVTVAGSDGLANAISEVRAADVGRDAIASNTATQVAYWRERLDALAAEIALHPDAGRANPPA